MSDPAPHAAAAQRAVEEAARASYGRLVAWLAARWRDVAAAEDALAEAFAAALRTWPAAGVPAKPEAWLLAAAHRRLIDAARHTRVRREAEPDLAATVATALERATAPMPFPDERLPLLFVCAHPAIAADVRTPLMLQTVLGLDAARIAAAFLVAPAAMGQRLVRAKNKIRAAGIAFRLPEPEELPARLAAVLEAVYAAYGTGWDDVAGTDPVTGGLAAEALSLGRLLVALLPEEPEARGLLALMLHCEARRAARRDAAGAYVPLSAQDPARWSAPLQAEAESHLRHAAAAQRPGPFQLEAAIQSAHAARAHTGRTDWPAIARLYAALIRSAPTLGAHVGQAAALAETASPAAALAALDALPAAAAHAYQPWWALRAHVLARLGRDAEAAAARTRAATLATDPAVRAFLATATHLPSA